MIEIELKPSSIITYESKNMPYGMLVNEDTFLIRFLLRRSYPMAAFTRGAGLFVHQVGHMGLMLDLSGGVK